MLLEIAVYIAKVDNASDWILVFFAKLFNTLICLLIQIVSIFAPFTLSILL